MINLTQISKRYGSQLLFKGVNLQFDPGYRYGIVGANGSGKSTLLRLIAGDETPDDGDISIPGNLRLGTMNQDHFAFESWIIKEVVLHGCRPLAHALAEKHDLLDDPHADAMRIAELEDIIALHDGYLADSQIAEMLVGLGIPPEKHDQPMGVLSGGYKLRVLLAQCLFSRPDVFLLDEPTNHLDIVSMHWLESFLVQCNRTVLLVSHDRTFLNRVSTHIADIDYQTIKIYTGNYDAFLDAKQAEELLRQNEAEKAEKRIEQLQQFVDRFRAKATKARQAQSKAKQIERMEKNLEQPVYSSRISPHFQFTPCRPPGKMVLDVKGIHKSFGSQVVLKGVDLKIRRGEKVAIIGPNGIGKSTLLKIIMGLLGPDGGEVEWGHETYPSYFAQDHSQAIPTDTTPFEWLYQFGPGEGIGRIRGLLGQLLFCGDDVHKSTAALSGGETARLILGKIMLEKGNVLVMDEPTNHLDMESIEALVNAFKVFDGTLLLVSHNRHVVRHVANRIVEIQPGAVDSFEGTYDEYLERKGIDHLDQEAALRQVRAPKKTTPKRNQRHLDAEKRREFNQQASPVRAEISNAERQIEALESELTQINEHFSDPSYFARAKPDEVRSLDQRKKALDRELETLLGQWENLQQELLDLKRQFHMEPADEG